MHTISGVTIAPGSPRNSRGPFNPEWVQYLFLQNKKYLKLEKYTRVQDFAGRMARLGTGLDKLILYEAERVCRKYEGRWGGILSFLQEVGQHSKLATAYNT